jgi:hypothetical protein
VREALQLALKRLLGLPKYLCQRDNVCVGGFGLAVEECCYSNFIAAYRFANVLKGQLLLRLGLEERLGREG